MRITKSEERWFPVPGDPDKGEVLICHLHLGTAAAIFEQTAKSETRYKPTGKDGKLEADTVILNNPAAEAAATMDAVIQDWKNIYGADGELMKCTTENKLAAKAEIPGFYEFINECREVLATDIDAEKAASEKN